MKKLFATVALLIAVAAEAVAGTSVLNVELGKTTSQQLIAEMGANTKLTSQGINQYSHGEMLLTSGEVYNIAGLNNVLFIFDESGVLSGVVLNMQKHTFDKVYQAISSKHKVAQLVKPFVGNRYARFNTSDAVIEINSPHLSFEMDVLYVSKDLHNYFEKRSKAEREAKRKQEASQF